jgi:hypothetical protein
VVVVVDVCFCLCGFVHMELLRLVDLQSCVSGALHLLRCSELRLCLSIVVFVGAYSGKLFDSTVLAVNCTVHTLQLKY